MEDSLIFNGSVFVCQKRAFLTLQESRCPELTSIELLYAILNTDNINLCQIVTTQMKS